MLTIEQRKQFVAALAAANLGIILEDDVVETRDTVADFSAEHRKAYSTQRNGLVIHSFHAGKGRQVHVANFGDARACYAE